MEQDLKQKEAPRGGFSEWIGSVPMRDYKDLRDQIMQATGVSTAAYSQWVLGKSAPTEKNRVEIAMIAFRYNGSQIFDDLRVSEGQVPGSLQVTFVDRQKP